MSFRVEQDGRLCRITLANPEKRNVLAAADCASLLEEIGNASQDQATGAILIDADGPVFCAGLEPEDDRLFSIGGSVQKPIVAAVRGVALSGGVALIANAHVAVAAQGTSFGLTAIREGRWSQAIVRAVGAAIGERRALELGLTGRVFSTPDALAWGLVQYAVPVFELDDRAMEIATALANANAEAIRAALER